MYRSHYLSKLGATTLGRNALKACNRFGLVYQFNKNSTWSQLRDLTKEIDLLRITIVRTNIPWFLMKPRSASSLWHISQVKHCGCQVDIMALMTRPMMNSPENSRTCYLWSRRWYWWCQWAWPKPLVPNCLTLGYLDHCALYTCHLRMG